MSFLFNTILFPHKNYLHFAGLIRVGLWGFGKLDSSIWALAAPVSGEAKS